MSDQGTNVEGLEQSLTQSEQIPERVKYFSHGEQVPIGERKKWSPFVRPGEWTNELFVLDEWVGDAAQAMAVGTGIEQEISEDSLSGGEFHFTLLEDDTSTKNAFVALLGQYSKMALPVVIETYTDANSISHVVVKAGEGRPVPPSVPIAVAMNGSRHAVSDLMEWCYPTKDQTNNLPGVFLTKKLEEILTSNEIGDVWLLKGFYSELYDPTVKWIKKHISDEVLITQVNKWLWRDDNEHKLHGVPESGLVFDIRVEFPEKLLNDSMMEKIRKAIVMEKRLHRGWCQILHAKSMVQHGSAFEVPPEVE